MKYLKALWQLTSSSLLTLGNAQKRFWHFARLIATFCTYLFVPQIGKQRRRMELLKKDITYLIGKERAEGNLEPITPLYVSRVLNVPLEEVEKCLKEMDV